MARAPTPGIDTPSTTVRRPPARCSRRSTSSEPVDWVGNAWGGHVGIVFAATWPDRCRTLVTFGTPIQAYGRSAAPPVPGPARRLPRRRHGGLPVERDLRRPAVAQDALERSRGGRAGARLPAHHGPAGARQRDGVDLLGAPGPDAATSRRSAARPCSSRAPTTRSGRGDQAEAASRLLADGSAAVVPDTAYLTPLEAPEATIRHVRDLWAQ